MISLFNAIYVDKALVLFFIALDHLLGEDVQVAQLKLCIELIIGASIIKLRGFVDNNLADFIYEDALLGRKEAHGGSYLQAQPMDELLQVQFLINLNGGFGYQPFVHPVLLGETREKVCEAVLFVDPLDTIKVFDHV